MRRPGTKEPPAQAAERYEDAGRCVKRRACACKMGPERASLRKARRIQKKGPDMKWRNLRRRAEPTEKAATGRARPSPPNRMRRGGRRWGERTARSGATRLCGPSGRAQIGIALARAAAASPALAFPSGHGRTDRHGDVFCCRATLATIAPRHAAKRRPALPFTRGYLFFQRAMAARNSSP